MSHVNPVGADAAHASAYAIAAQYRVDRVIKRPRRRIPLTAAEVAWAWDRYHDETRATSLNTLSHLLGVTHNVLRLAFMRRDGFTYARMAERRGCCGDLFKRDYHANLG